MAMRGTQISVMRTLMKEREGEESDHVKKEKVQ